MEEPYRIPTSRIGILWQGVWNLGSLGVRPHPPLHRWDLNHEVASIGMCLFYLVEIAAMLGHRATIAGLFGRMSRKTFESDKGKSNWRWEQLQKILSIEDFKC